MKYPLKFQQLNSELSHMKHTQEVKLQWQSMENPNSILHVCYNGHDLFFWNKY